MIAPPPRARKRGTAAPGKASHGGDIETDQPVHRIEVGVGETAGRNAGIVDEDADTAVIAQARFDPRQIGAIGEIGGYDIYFDSRLAAQTRCELLHPRLVARDQNKVMPAPGETVGVGRSDSGRRAGDENGRKLAIHDF